MKPKKQNLSKLTLEEEQALSHMVETFKTEMNVHQQAAYQILNRDFSGLSKEQVRFFSTQIVSYFNFIPASVSFRVKVRSKFGSQPQINFTLQNFLTWHFIGHVLIDYLQEAERFEKFESYADTALDKKRVEVLKSLVTSKLTLDQIRYFYFKMLAPDILEEMLFNKYTQLELTDLLKKLVLTGDRGISKDELYELQPFFQILPPMNVFAYKMALEKDRSKYGAVGYKLNTGDIETIFYREHYEGLPVLKEGEINISNVKKFSELKDYFKTRRQAENLFSTPGLELKVARIQDEIVGIIGLMEGKVYNIHVPGDYRRRGIAKQLLQTCLNERPSLTISPIGDSLAFVQAVSAFNPKQNIGIITEATLSKDKNQKPKFKSFEVVIKDSEEKYPSFVGEGLIAYAKNNYEDADLSTRIALVNGEPVGCLIYSPVKDHIVSLYISKSCRGRGIGTRLIESLSSSKVWCLETSLEGAPFWMLRATLSSDQKLYYSRSPKNLQQYLKKQGLHSVDIPPLYVR